VNPCHFCGRHDPSPEWGVLFSVQLGARCCLRCYELKTKAPAGEVAM
jgi:hypothetical protein